MEKQEHENKQKRKRMLAGEILRMNAHLDKDFLYVAQVGEYTLQKWLLEPKKWSVKRYNLLAMALHFYKGRKGYVPQVMPNRVDNVHVYITCPFCLKKHTHGSCGGQDYAGSRVAHCRNSPWVEYEILEKEQ